MSNARNLARLLPNASGQLPDAAMASGSVLQVVYAQANTERSTSSAYTELLGVSASITPVSTTSKILVLGRIPFKHNKIASNVAAWSASRIYRNGTIIQPTPGEAYEQGINLGNSNWSDFRKVHTIQTLDSPETTGTLTYEYRAFNYDTAATLTICEGGMYKASLILMEIAG